MIVLLFQGQPCASHEILKNRELPAYLRKKAGIDAAGGPYIGLLFHTRIFAFKASSFSLPARVHSLLSRSHSPLPKPQEQSALFEPFSAKAQASPARPSPIGWFDADAP
jgi:hypothetical protein